MTITIESTVADNDEDSNPFLPGARGLEEWAEGWHWSKDQRVQEVEQSRKKLHRYVLYHRGEKKDNCLRSWICARTSFLIWWSSRIGTWPNSLLWPAPRWIKIISNYMTSDTIFPATWSLTCMPWFVPEYKSSFSTSPKVHIEAHCKYILVVYSAQQGEIQLFSGNQQDLDIQPRRLWCSRGGFDSSNFCYVLLKLIYGH